MQVSEGIHRLTQGVTNFYLVAESGKYTVVDAGTPGDWDVLRAARSPGSAPRWPTWTRCCSPTRTPITPASPSGPAPRPARRSGSTAPTSRPRAPEDRPARRPDHALPAAAAFYRTPLSLLRRGGSRMVPIVEVSAFGDGEQIDMPGQPSSGARARPVAGQRGAAARGPPDPGHRRRPATENALTGRIGPQIMPSGLNRTPPRRSPRWPRCSASRGPAAARPRRSVDRGRGRGRSAGQGGGALVGQPAGFRRQRSSSMPRSSRRRPRRPAGEQVDLVAVQHFGLCPCSTRSWSRPVAGPRSKPHRR